MPRKLVISNEAIYDLETIWDYIARDNPTVADLFIDELFDKCTSVSNLDGVGRKREELQEGLLSIPHKRYVIFFIRNNAEIQIVRILNAALDSGAIFE